MQNVQRAARRSVGERLGGAAATLHGVPGGLDIEERQAAVFAHLEAGDRIVAAIRREQETSIRGQDDAGGTLEGIRRALLAADRLERSGTGTASEDTFGLGNRTVRRPREMNDRVLNLVGLHVEMPTMLHRPTHVFRFAHLLRHVHLLFRLLVMRMKPSRGVKTIAIIASLLSRQRWVPIDINPIRSARRYVTG